MSKANKWAMEESIFRPIDNEDMENKQCGESIWDEPSQTTPKAASINSNYQFTGHKDSVKEASKKVGPAQYAFEEGDAEIDGDIMVIREIFQNFNYEDDQVLKDLLAIHGTFDIFIALGNVAGTWTVLNFEGGIGDDNRIFLDTVETKLKKYREKFAELPQKIAEYFEAPITALRDKIYRDRACYTYYTTLLENRHLSDRRFKQSTIRNAGIFAPEPEIKLCDADDIDLLISKVLEYMEDILNIPTSDTRSLASTIITIASGKTTLSKVNKSSKSSKVASSNGSVTSHQSGKKSAVSNASKRSMKSGTGHSPASKTENNLEMDKSNVQSSMHSVTSHQSGRNSTVSSESKSSLKSVPSNWSLDDDSDSELSVSNASIRSIKSCAGYSTTSKTSKISINTTGYFNNFLHLSLDDESDSEETIAGEDGCDSDVTVENDGTEPDVPLANDEAKIPESPNPTAEWQDWKQLKGKIVSVRARCLPDSKKLTDSTKSLKDLYHQLAGFSSLGTQNFYGVVFTNNNQVRVRFHNLIVPFMLLHHQMEDKDIDKTITDFNLNNEDHQYGILLVEGPFENKAKICQKIYDRVHTQFIRYVRVDEVDDILSDVVTWIDKRDRKRVDTGLYFDLVCNVQNAEKAILYRNFCHQNGIIPPKEVQLVIDGKSTGLEGHGPIHIEENITNAIPLDQAIRTTRINLRSQRGDRPTYDYIRPKNLDYLNSHTYKWDEGLGRSFCEACGGNNHTVRNCKKGGGSLLGIKQCMRNQTGTKRVPGASTLCFPCNTRGHNSSNCPYRHPNSYDEEHLCWNCSSDRHLRTHCPLPRYNPETGKNDGCVDIRKQYSGLKTRQNAGQPSVQNAVPSNNNNGKSSNFTGPILPPAELRNTFGGRYVPYARQFPELFNEQKDCKENIQGLHK